MNIPEELKIAYAKRWPADAKHPFVTTFAPGRVEILGNHTDYNDGFVLTAAIEQKTWFVGKVTGDNKISLIAHDLQESLECSYDDLPELKKGHWGSYLIGLLKIVGEKFPLRKGFRVIFGGNVPFAAGCSSSASLEAGFLYFIKTIEQLSLSTKEMALICQKAENEYAGVPCGLMDQWSVMHGKKNELIFFDCRKLETQTVKVNQSEFSLLIINTNIKHTLVDSLYRKRREECTSAVKKCQENGFKMTHLRDLKTEDLPLIKPFLTIEEWKRTHHVVTENDRIQKLLELPLEQRALFLQSAMAESHASSKDFFENSCAELDFIESTIKKQEGCLGAKLSGGGFGGCVVALIEKNKLEAISNKIISEYEKNFKNANKLTITLSAPSECAGVVIF
jgi:galactokinase